MVPTEHVLIKNNKNNDQQPQRQASSVYFNQKLLLMIQCTLAMSVCEHETGVDIRPDMAHMDASDHF